MMTALKKAKHILTAVALVAILGVGMSAEAVVVTNITSDVADAHLGVNSNDVVSVLDIGNAEFRAGGGNLQYSKADMCSVFMFQLPSLDGGTVSSANIGINTRVSYPGALSYPVSLDLYGVRSASTPTVLASDYAPVGDNVGNGTLIQNDVVSLTDNNDQTYASFTPISTSATGDAALASWISAQYDAGAVAGDYVFLRLNTDVATANYWITASADHASESPPTLTLEIIPFVAGPPVANFTALPTSGTAPLVVSFSDISTGTVANRFWDFGDGNTLSTANKTASHTYTTEGVRTVQLIVSGADGSSTNTMTDLIDVAPPITGFAIPASALDQVVRGDGTVGTSLNWAGQKDDQISGAQSGEVVVPFILPDLEGTPIASANLLAALKADTWLVWGNVDVYGVRHSSSGAVALSDYAPFSDAAGNGTKIMDNFFVAGSGTAAYQDLETDATGDAALAAWLIAQYDDGAVAGDYVFIRFQPDHMDAVTSHAINFATADTITETTPVLTIELDTSVPAGEGDFVSAEAAGSGLVKLVFTATGNLGDLKLVGRTDLVFGSWDYTPHSDDGVNAFITTDLSYSTADGTNYAIYVEATNSAAFYGIE